MQKLTLSDGSGTTEAVAASASAEGVVLIGGALAASLSPLTWSKLLRARLSFGESVRSRGLTSPPFSGSARARPRSHSAWPR